MIRIFHIFFSDERTICQFDCQNGGRCNARGECECRPGYLGQQCQQGEQFETFLCGLPLSALSLL